MGDEKLFGCMKWQMHTSTVFKMIYLFSILVYIYSSEWLPVSFSQSSVRMVKKNNTSSYTNWNYDKINNM